MGIIDRFIGRDSEDVRELKDHMLLMSDAVQQNTKVISPATEDQDYMLHVAVSEQKVFIPYYSRKAASTEDNTITRVYVSNDIVGCLLGFSSAAFLVDTHKPNPSKGTDVNDGSVEFPIADYRGGVYIHKIPFKAGLAPNEKLCQDVPITREKWLVTYSQDTREFPAEIVGKIIFNRKISEPRMGELPHTVMEFYIEITDRRGVAVTPDKALKTGYYSLLFDYQGDGKDAVIEPISTSDWAKAHKLKAAVLSNQPEVTRMVSWSKLTKK